MTDTNPHPQSGSDARDALEGRPTRQPNGVPAAGRAARPSINGRITLSVTEAAELLGISRNLAYELVARGELPAVRLGRRIVIPARALETLVTTACPRKLQAAPTFRRRQARCRRRPV